jgi:hypothetical protein
MITCYFSVKKKIRNKIVVIKSTAYDLDLAEEKARQWAKTKGLKLSGSSFSEDWKRVLSLDGKYHILSLPKGFRAKK